MSVSIISTNFYKVDFKRYLAILKKVKLSNASNNITRLNCKFLLQYKFKKLFLRKSWSAGRSNTGRITVFSKGTLKKNREILVNYSFRQSFLFFIGGLNYSNFNKTKIATIIFSSNGSVTYIPMVENSYFFVLTLYKNILTTKNSLYRDLCFLKPYLQILEKPFLLLQQTKNTPISFLELKLTSGSQYSRSLGSKSKLLKLDTRTGYGLVILPSFLKKVFSIFALASNGPANLSIFRRDLRSTKSGEARALGIKPKVRGVAKNPVDHPHGGRTKAIKYQRTPWGKTTKYK